MGVGLSDVLTVVLVHRDQPERCIQTVRAFADQEVETHIVVVDNGSRPGAVEAIASGAPACEIVEARRNAGFGGGANVGLRRWLDTARGEWVVVAPHDALPEPGCLERLLTAVEGRPRAGLASAEYGEPGCPAVDRYLGAILAPSERTPGWEDAGHPHGTLLLARRACLEDVGLFDERYFAYCEEADLGVRASRAGWEVGIVWGAVVKNPGVATHADAVDYLKLRNTLLLVRSHSGLYPAFVRLVIAIVGTAWLGALPHRRKEAFSFRARALAIVDFLRGRFGPPPAELLAGR